MSFRTRTPPAVSPFSLRLHVLSYGFVLGAMLVVQSSHAQITVTAEQRWATYLGGEADDQVLSVATDAFGHVYVAGRTSNGLRLGNDTTDASGLTHQDTLGGGASDAFLAKIAPQGSMLWCTYFGGAGDDEAVQVVVTDMDGVYLVGNTTSTEAIATDSLGLQTVPGGNGDLFVARFTEYGRLLGATYLGGSDVETATGAALDGLGRLVVCGSSDGPNSFTNGPLPVQPFDEDQMVFSSPSTAPTRWFRGRIWVAQEMM
ncbi:MAG: SBBP repeat-containing protein [Flavobacteriales bacterium]|nr:SBBP repeat-containing protein [Flavobacteriales bacterium]